MPSVGSWRASAHENKVVTEDTNVQVLSRKETSHLNCTSSERGGIEDIMESAQPQSTMMQEPATRFLSRARAREFPSDAQWLKHRPMIRKLYVDEDRTLQDVVEIMKKDFGFDVTAKMYKSRLKAWGYRKNIRLRHGEDKSLIPLLHDTVQHPEQSETASRAVRLRNGQIVSHDRLVKHLRRRGEGRASTNTKMTVRAIKSPDVLYVSEAVLFQVRTYIHGPWQESVSTAERLDLLRDECAANEEWNSIAHGVRRALDERKLNEALVLMRRAPDVLANLIERRPANMLQVLFMSLSYFTSGGRLERTEATQLSVVVKCLVKYAAAFTSNDQGLPRSHPIHQMFYMLANADEQDIHPLATKAWLTNCQLWDGVMDRPRSTCAVASWISYGEFNGFDAMPSNLGNIIKFMVDYNAAKLGEHHRRTIHLSQIYTTYLTCREKANGKDPFFNDDVVRSFGALLRRGPQGPMRIDALGWLARACRARRDRDSAEAYMRELIDLMLKDSTHRDTSTRDLINDLEMWFIEWGETEKAAGLARWRDEELGAEATA